MKSFLLSGAAVLAGDQISKIIVKQALAPGRVIDLLGPFVRLRYVSNLGSAFGFFHGGRVLLIAVSAIAIAIILYLMIKRRYVFRGSRLAFGLVFGGALGNLIDRTLRTGVIDFIDAGVGRFRWPTFNVADAAVTIGVAYLVVSVAWHDRRPAPEAAVHPDGPVHDE